MKSLKVVLERPVSFEWFKNTAFILRKHRRNATSHRILKFSKETQLARLKKKQKLLSPSLSVLSQILTSISKSMLAKKQLSIICIYSLYCILVFVLRVLLFFFRPLTGPESMRNAVWLQDILASYMGRCLDFQGWSAHSTKLKVQYPLH